MIPRTRLHRMGWHFVLAVLLLWMQQAGLRHALEHKVHEDDSAPTHAACLLCMAHHAQDQAMPGGLPPVVAAPSASHVLHAAVAKAQCAQGVSLSYLSRAPPSGVSA